MDFGETLTIPRDLFVGYGRQVENHWSMVQPFRFQSIHSIRGMNQPICLWYERRIVFYLLASRLEMFDNVISISVHNNVGTYWLFGSHKVCSGCEIVCHRMSIHIRVCFHHVNKFIFKKKNSVLIVLFSIYIYGYIFFFSSEKVYSLGTYMIPRFKFRLPLLDLLWITLLFVQENCPSIVKII
ncbi:Hypothetical protein CINCED_3A010344 [Cinara cedri]|uniref:Uncharacterized protein n=1 Tax=Cinara cedri TaxID=506608 RepID=A0A5E4MEV7_9HEMI|nr:Hypothetical protein CINCED_3A010344 [Cinara cedri]